MLKLPPGAIVAEFHTLVSDVEVCAVLSLLTQVTTPPRWTVTGFGLYAVVVKVLEPDTIDTWVPPVAGAGDGFDGVELPPHAVPKHVSAKKVTIHSERRITFPPNREVAIALPSLNGVLPRNICGHDSDDLRTV